jgi:2-dehydropantoate 2-reductase
MAPSESNELMRVVGGPRFLVVGAGGIGAIVTAYLAEQGHDVTALTTNHGIASAIEAHGIRVRGDDSPGAVRAKAVTSLGARDGKFDFVLLATQPPDVEKAAASALPYLADDGAMVCFQNGLVEERIAKIAGNERVVGAIVAWGASMIEPGLYDRTSSGGFAIGRIDASGPSDEKLRALARALECIGPVTVTENLLGARWSKLAINCAISSLGTVGGDTLGSLMRHRFVRRMALEIMTEATSIARASNVKLEKVAGTIDLDWISLSDDDRVSIGSPGLVAKHALLLAVGARYRRLRSSMLSAIERGRTPSVDFLNGEVVARGKLLGIATPINAAIQDEVWSIAKGSSLEGKGGRSSFTRVRALFDKTRALVPSRNGSPPAARTEESEPLPAALDPIEAKPDPVEAKPAPVETKPEESHES